MAVIHIDPLPPRVSPGEVLRFIAERGKIDGKKVGKIAFIGRGATVEVPDEKAAALVAALDGATFRDKPIRARLRREGGLHRTPITSPTSRDSSTWKPARSRKRRAAGRRRKRARRSATASRSRARRFARRSSGSAAICSSPSATSRSPRCRRPDSSPGSPVVVSQTNVNRRMPSYRGVVFDRDETTIGVAIDPPDDDLAEDATWRLDLSPDEVSRLRQQDALRRAAAATGDRLAELRAVLLGEREPAFDPSPNPSAAGEGSR